MSGRQYRSSESEHNAARKGLLFLKAPETNTTKYKNHSLKLTEMLLTLAAQASESAEAQLLGKAALLCTGSGLTGTM